METMTYRILFFIFAIYVLINSISYGITEIKKENNKFGGFCVITFSILTVLFTNIVIWQR